MAVITLIVSKIIDRKFINISDSQIMEKLDGKKYTPNPNSLEGVVKTIIVTRRICVSYAGIIYYADQAIKKILEMRGSFSLKEILEIFVDSNNRSNNETHYAVAFIQENRQPIQYKISNGEFVDYTNSLLWLGDSRAFEVFEKKFNELMKLDDKNEKSHLQTAFDVVIQDKTIESVDKFQIITVSDMKKNKKSMSFKYIERFLSGSNNSIKITPKSNTYNPIFVDPLKDLNGYSLFASYHTTLFGVAVYDIGKKAGVLFCPQLKLGSTYFERVKGKTIYEKYQNFIDIIWENYQLPLKGFIWLPDTAGAKLIHNVPKSFCV